jgi:hypothetical protein
MVTPPITASSTAGKASLNDSGSSSPEAYEAVASSRCDNRREGGYAKSAKTLLPVPWLFKGLVELIDAGCAHPARRPNLDEIDRSAGKIVIKNTNDQSPGVVSARVEIGAAGK